MAVNLNELKRLIREALNNAYKLLGVSPQASHDEIKAAYRKLAVQLHPDRNKAPDATAKMAKVNRAWTVLSDPTSRRKYDMSGDRTVDDEGNQQTQQPRSRSQADDMEDFIKRAWEKHPNNPKNRERARQERADADER